MGNGLAVTVMALALLSASFAGAEVPGYQFVWVKSFLGPCCSDGGADLSIPPRQAREMGRRYREAGGEAIVRVYPGANHMQLVTSFSEPERWRYPVYKDLKAFLDASGTRRIGGTQRSARPTIRVLELDRQ